MSEVLSLFLDVLTVLSSAPFSFILLIVSLSFLVYLVLDLVRIR